MSPLERNPIKQVIEGDFLGRIHEISHDTCSFEAASHQMAEWQTEGEFTVFNAGTFDILTLNHILGLVQCRTLGAMAMLGIEEITAPEELHKVHDLASSSQIRLMITLDTNRALEEGKSRKVEKGGAPKPTLDWRNRAIMLAVQSIPSVDYLSRVNAVDYITRHGPECCNVCEDSTCINEDNALMVLSLRPDLVVVNSRSLQTITDLEYFKEKGLLPDTRVAIIIEDDNQYYDEILEGPVKTTSIISRVRS